MREELESKKAAVNAKIQAELETQRLSVERTRHKRKEKLAKKKSCRRKIISGIIFLIILVLITLIASTGVSVQSGNTTNYPYIATYNIWFPIDEPIDISGHKLIAFFDGNEMMFSSDRSVMKLVHGDPITINEQTATLTTLFDKVLIITINCRIILEYQGNTAENFASFKMFIQSDKIIPEFIVDFVLPKNVIAQSI
jgi:hypothetical protein